MNKPPQNSVQTPDYLKARKLHLDGIIIALAAKKKPNNKDNKVSKVETLTVEAIKAELDFIVLELKRKGG